MMEADRLIETLGALGQTTRLGIVAALAAEGGGGLSAGHLAAVIGTPTNTMSTHLGILARAGVVASERSGRIVTYRLAPDCLRDIAAHLTSIADVFGDVPSTG